MIQAMPSPVAALCRERRSIKGFRGLSKVVQATRCSISFARCAFAASFPLGKGVCLQERPNLSFDGKDRATGFGHSHVPASSQVVCIFQFKIIQAFVDFLWQGLEKQGWRDSSYSVTGGCKCFALSNKVPLEEGKGSNS